MCQQRSVIQSQLETTDSQEACHLTRKRQVSSIDQYSHRVLRLALRTRSPNNSVTAPRESLRILIRWSLLRLTRRTSDLRAWCGRRCGRSDLDAQVVFALAPGTAIPICTRRHSSCSRHRRIARCAPVPTQRHPDQRKSAVYVRLVISATRFSRKWLAAISRQV